MNHPRCAEFRIRPWRFAFIEHHVFVLDSVPADFFLISNTPPAAPPENFES
ncbi:hypothetical protein LJR230_004260 [Trinickia sp. LjRoot230]|uniref:hypothetical protein n=1 Tax=Trinickia sp. LjRoot230 TaxID=3342288 RepID=UPI003ED0B3A2